MNNFFISYGIFTKLGTKESLQSPNIFSRPCIPVSAIKDVPMKGIIITVQSKLRSFLCF